MIKNNSVWVKIQTNKEYKLLLKLNELGITINDSKRINNSIIIKTTTNDYKKIKKYLIQYKISIYKYNGINQVIYYIKKNIIYFISIIICIILIVLINNMVFKININTQNKDVKKILIKELKNYNMGILSFKKRHKDIEKIVKKIIANNDNILEWIEIEYKGITLNINVVEKTIYKDKISNNYCNIIATKDAKIISVLVKNGVAEKEINSYALKDEILINGLVKNGEEIKNTTCANGTVYGEVWYKVIINMPLKETYKVYTGIKRNNILITYNNKKRLLFRDRIKEYDMKMINIYTLKNFKIDLIKEKEYIKKERLLNENKGIEKAKKIAISKIEKKLNKDEEIIMQNVLKKSLNNSTIYLELFVVTKENIGALSIINNN